MFSKIINIEPVKLIGMRIRTSLAKNETVALWQRFMPRRKEIENLVPARFYSVQIYDQIPDERNFTGETEFEKWAAVEVSEFAEIPAGGMEKHILSGGRYAVFIHKGTTAMFQHTAQYIFGRWLPASEYELDAREHFEVMDDKYLGHENPESEEEIWIPIRKREK